MFQQAGAGDRVSQSDTPDRRKRTGRPRNRVSILASAQTVLTTTPDASMEDTAAAAGVVRRTVYGHFANRAELLNALVRQNADKLLTPPPTPAAPGMGAHKK